MSDQIPETSHSEDDAPGVSARSGEHGPSGGCPPEGVPPDPERRPVDPPVPPVPPGPQDPPVPPPGRRVG